MEQGPAGRVNQAPVQGGARISLPLFLLSLPLREGQRGARRQARMNR